MIAHDSKQEQEIKKRIGMEKDKFEKLGKAMKNDKTLWQLRSECLVFIHA